MSKDKLICIDGHAKTYNSYVGGTVDDYAEALGASYKHKQVSLHGMANHATGQGFSDILDGIRASKFGEGASRFFDRVFNPVDKSTGFEKGFLVDDLTNFLRTPEDMLGKITQKLTVVDGAKLSQSLPQRIRHYSEAYFKNKKNSTVNPTKFVRGLRPILLEAIEDFNSKFPVVEARELTREGDYDTVADALKTLLPKEYASTRDAQRLISIKNYLDSYVKYWENGGDSFRLDAKNPIVKVINTMTGTLINSDLSISMYNFHELHKGLSYAVSEIGDFGQALKVYGKTFAQLREQGFFTKNEQFAEEFKTLYQRHNRMPRPDNSYGKAIARWEEVLGKSDDMLRTFYYQLGKNISESKSGNKNDIEFGKKAVTDNIYLYDIANRPMYLSGETGTIVYNMMRFFMGQTVQTARYASNMLKDKASFMAFATHLGTFHMIYGVQGTLSASLIAGVGEAVNGKDEWKKFAKEVDEAVPFLDLNDKALTLASNLVGGGDVNASYRTTIAGSPYLGVGVSRFNTTMDKVKSSFKKLTLAVKNKDVVASSALIADLTATGLLFSPSYGTGVLSDATTAFSKAWLGRTYKPNASKITYDVLIDKLQEQYLNDEPS